MTDLRKAAEMALEALETIRGEKDIELAHIIAKNARYSLREALAQGEQKTVHFLANGVRYKVTHQGYYGCSIVGLPENLNGQWVALVEATDSKHLNCIALQESTKPEQDHLSDSMSVLADVNADLIAEAKLAQTEQEPDFWIGYDPSEGGKFLIDADKPSNEQIALYEFEPVYTAPPSKPWQSLTDEEINKLMQTIDWRKDWLGSWAYKEFARAIEAALRSKNT